LLKEHIIHLRETKRDFENELKLVDTIHKFIDSSLVIEGRIVEIRRTKGHEPASDLFRDSHLETMVANLQSFFMMNEAIENEYFAGLNSENEINIRNSSKIILLFQVITIVLLLAGAVVIFENLRLRNKAVASLRKSEEQFRNLVENSLVGVLRTNINGNILYINDAVLKIFEFESKDELILSGSTILYKNAEQRNEIIALLKKKGHIDGKEITTITKKGKARILLFSMVIQGDIIDSTVLDITDRKEAELKLTRNLKFTEALLNSIPTPVFFKDMQGRYTGCNKAFSDQMGMKPEQIIGKTVFELWPDEQATIYHNKDMDLISEAQYQVFESTVTDKNKQIRNVLFAKDVFFDESGNAAGIVGAFIDITERKQAEEKLRQLSQAVEQSPVIIVITDTTGTIQYVNPKFVETTGYSAKEAIGKNPRILKSGHTSPEEYSQLWELLSSGKEWRGEFQNRKITGELYWETASISPIKNAEGETTHFLAIKEDITERKRTEEILKKQATELKNSNADLENFAYVASHDLQEPLRMVSSFLTLLEKRISGQLDETTLQYVHYAVDGADRMKILITDLLQYSRVGTNKEIFSQFDLKEVMQYMTLVLKENITKSQAKITIKQLPVITANNTLINQLFINLVSNALKYYDGKTPEIEIGFTEYPEVNIFYVSDNGIGISQENFEKIFIIFKRLHSKGKYSGTGIGLALCKKIVEMHNGKIWVESVLGKGSTFYFSIPKQNEKKIN
jgi:PAS domain S-box-containing protein